MIPIVAALMQSGLTLLAGAVKAKGQDFVEKKLGVKLEDHMGTEDGRIRLAQIEMENEESLREYAVKMAENDLAGFKIEVEDRGSARTRDAEFIKQGTRNYRADVMFLLAVAIVSLLVWIVWKDGTLNEYVKGIFTLVLGRFLGYLDNIYNFEFGTTRGSRDKDSTIEKLTRGDK